MAKRYPRAKIIIALPTLNENIYNSHAHKMLEEIVVHGIDSSRFLFETDEPITREQAINIAKLTGAFSKDCFLIITSPEHVYRSVKVFSQGGFENCVDFLHFLKNYQANFCFQRMKTYRKSTRRDRFLLFDIICGTI
jgi:uncharacterized SAM-binding protein YcdF (DUF218 family)